MRYYTFFLGLLVLLLAVPPAAAADMIYWEDSCDSLTYWSGWYQTWWTVSPEYSHGETSYGIGHPWVRRDQEVYGYMPRPPASSGVIPRYVTFWARLQSDPLNSDDYGYHNSSGHVTIDGDYAEFDDDGEASMGGYYANRWVQGYFAFPASASLGPSDITLRLRMEPGPNGAGAQIMIDTIQFVTSSIIPAFTASTTGGEGPLTVQFTDQTHWSEGNIVGWYWQFGDGATSTQQHPSHTYPYLSSGQAYDVSLTTTTRWGQENTTVKAAYIVVGTVAEGDFTVDFTGTPTNGTSPLTVTFTGTVSPAETNITSWRWDFGDGAQGFGQTLAHTYNTYTSNAQYDVTLTGVASSTGTVNSTTKAAYITVNGSSGSSGGVASLSTVKVRFVVLDYVGQRFNNVTVTATPLESTGPWGWLEDLLGIPGEVDVENEVLTGTTGTDGAIVFTMVESVKYRVDITDASQGISTSITIYPKEDEIPVYIWPATTPPLGETVTYDLSATPLDDENTRLRLTYSDALDNTTSVTFYVTTENGTLIHSETETGKGNVTLSYEIVNVPGEVFIFGFEATHGTYGTITQDQFIRFESNRPRVDFAPWIPLWVYNWVAIGIIVCIAAIFGFQTLKFGVVLVPVFALLFTYMEWLDTPVLLTLCAMTLGILLYMRYSEGETGT
jgi:PKD repeat protein